MTTSRLARLIPGICAGFLLLLSGCGKHETATQIGVLVPMTGSSANYGELMRKGAELAAEQVNARGGVAGQKLVLVFEDSKGQPKDGVAALNKLITVDKVPAVAIAFSSVISACAPVARASKIVLLNCPANSPKFRGQPYLWNTSVLSDQEGVALADTAIRRFRAKRAAILYNNNDSGQGFRQVISSRFEALGGKVLLAEGHDQGTKDFRAVLARIQAARPDVVFLTTYYLESGLILKQAQEAGIRTHWLSYSSILTPDFLQIAGPAANGVVCTLPGFDAESPKPETQAYVKDYRAKYGADAELWGAQFYDGVRLLAEAMARGAKSGEQIEKALQSMPVYHGVAGDIKFAPDHTIAKTIELRQVRDGQFGPYSL